MLRAQKKGRVSYISHVAEISIEIRNLDDLATACERIGCELVLGQKTYRWYGRSVGDYPLPQGRTVKDLGKCEHAIRVKKAGPQTYEVGVCKKADGSWGLEWDFYAGGYGLQAKVGDGAEELVKSYAASAAMRAARKLGYKVAEKRLATGEIQLTASRA